MDQHRRRSLERLRSLPRLRLRPQLALRGVVQRGLEVRRHHLDQNRRRSLELQNRLPRLRLSAQPALRWGGRSSTGSGSTTARAGSTPLEESRAASPSPSLTTQSTTCSSRGRTAWGSGSTTARAGPTQGEGSRETRSTPSPTTQACSTLGRTGVGSGSTTARAGPTPAEESRAPKSTPSSTTQATTCSTRGRATESGSTRAPGLELRCLNCLQCHTGQVSYDPSLNKHVSPIVSPQLRVRGLALCPFVPT